MSQKLTKRLAYSPALAGLLGFLTGCQSLPGVDSRPVPQQHQAKHSSLISSSANGSPAKISPAQEADVQIAFAKVAEKQGDLEGAMSAYSQAIQKDKKRADACIRLAVLNDRLGQFGQSEPLYKQALHQRPADPEIFCDMGYSYYLQRRSAEAERCLNQALVIQADHPRAHNNLALLKAREGNLDAALTEFRKAGGTDCQAQCNLAFALALDGKLSQARQHYSLALAAEPGSALARQRLSQLETVASRLPQNSNSRTEDRQVVTTQMIQPSTQSTPATAPATKAKPGIYAR